MRQHLKTQKLFFGNGLPDSSTTSSLLDLLRELLGQGLSVRVTVTGRSMQPFLQGGESVILRSVRSEALQIGDLIFFVDTGNRPVLHRIVRRKRQKKTIQFQTKGDGLVGLDAPIFGSQVLGRVEKVFAGEPGNATDIVGCLNLNHYRQRVNAVYFAKRSLSLWYYNRLKKLVYKIIVHGRFKIFICL